MPASVLVGYATRYGSTQEVAEAVAAELRKCGVEASVAPLKQVRTLEEYSAVVLGAPLYIGAWPGDAKRFLAKHQTALAQRPVAIFSLGPLSSAEGEMQGTRAQLDKQLSNFPWLKPVDVALFVGRFDPQRLHFPDNLVTMFQGSPLYQVPASDRRDWAAIHAWASSLAVKLKPA